MWELEILNLIWDFNSKCVYILELDWEFVGIYFSETFEYCIFGILD